MNFQFIRRWRCKHCELLKLKQYTDSYKLIFCKQYNNRLQKASKLQIMAYSKFIKSVLLGIPIGITFLDCVGYVARVDGISMQPALNPESSNQTDYVFLSRWAVRCNNVQRGDIVSLISPKDPSQKIIKRVVGLQGDVIATLGYKQEIVRVPEGHCWVEGDHTGHSLDSNTFGPVALGLMTARAACIVWPPERWRDLPTELPRRRRPIQVAKSTNYH